MKVDTHSVHSWFLLDKTPRCRTRLRHGAGSCCHLPQGSIFRAAQLRELLFVLHFFCFLKTSEGNVALKRGCGVAIPQVKGNVTCFNHAAEESGKRMTMSAETTWRSPEGWIMFARRPSKWLVTMVPSGSLSFCISMQKYEYTCSKSD